jgi:hypothetical protein
MSLDIRIPSYLPDRIVITRSTRIADMILISKLDGVGSRRDLAGL